MSNIIPKPFDERSNKEQQAIKEYCSSAHKSNVPDNIDQALWKFYKNRKTGKIEAGLILTQTSMRHLS